MTGDDRAEVWLGLDLGTQSVRALAVDAAGQVAGSGRQLLTSHRDGNRHEQDPEQWWNAVATACREALTDIPAHAVRGVAVDATSGTVLLVDGAGRACSPALMYDDGRASSEVVRVDLVGHELWAELGYQRMQPTWALPKLLWLLRNHGQPTPDVRLAHQSDFITRRLTGHEVATDLSSALKTGVDLIRETWPGDVIDDLLVPRSVLPALVRTGAPLGTVSVEAAAATGLSVGTPVVAGATDGVAAQLGAGVTGPGSWNSVLGTTLVLKGVSRELVRDPCGAVYSHRGPAGDWLPGGASSTGAAAVSLTFDASDLGRLERAAASFEPASVVSYPLTGHGERFPFVAPEAGGFLLGKPNSEGEHYAAVLQGVAMVERLCFDSLDKLGAPTDGALVLTGGATRSRYWCQLRADMLARPVLLPEIAEPALGMAVLAASASGLSTSATARMVRIRDTLDPRPGSREIYDHNYVLLINELVRRGWLPQELADYARERTFR